MKKIFILFVVLFACVGCNNYNSLSQDIIVTDIKCRSIKQGECIYTVKFFNRDNHVCTGTISFYGKRGEYSCGDTLRLIKLNEK